MSEKTGAEGSALTTDPPRQSNSNEDSKVAEENLRKKRSLRAEMARRREALKRQEAERKLPGQILLIIFNSLGVAIVLVMAAALTISNLPSNSPFAEPDFGKLLLVMSFLLGFFVTLLFLMRRLPPNWWQLANEFATMEKYQAPKEKWGGVLKTSPRDYQPLFDMTRTVSEIPPSLSHSTEDAPFSRVASETEQLEDSIEQQPLEPRALFTDNDAPVPESADNVQLSTADLLAKSKTLAIEEIGKFAKSTVDALRTTERTLDSIGRFVMQLFLAGACSAVARKFLLSAKDSITLLIEALVQSGIGKAFAESFAMNVEEFAKRESYRQAISSGQKAMEQQLRGEQVEMKDFARVLNTWSDEVHKRLPPRVVTFLITDIVDAAALTQRLGNLHTQRVIKAHDEAVDIAIEKNKGKKVRHTGDGVIATFPDPARAIAAAQGIQQKLDEHNKRMPHLSTNVRIAVNAGEAGEDSDGYFGAAIKMTAQICDQAKTSQILAADVVRSFCKSSQQAFKPFGEILISELDKSRPIFEVSWAKAGTRIEYGDIGQPAA